MVLFISQEENLPDQPIKSIIHNADVGSKEMPGDGLFIIHGDTTFQNILLHSIYIPCRYALENAILFGEDYSAASDCHNVRKGMNGNEIYLKQRDLCGYRKWGEGNQIMVSLAIQTESQTEGCFIPVAAYNKIVEIEQMFLSQRTLQHTNCSDTNCTQV